MQLSFSPQAALDLEEIGDYIARDNPDRALSFLTEIEAHCYRVAEMPNAFPRREDLAPGLQIAVHRNYLILFRVQERSIRIERIVHGARRLGDLVHITIVEENLSSDNVSRGKKMAEILEKLAASPTFAGIDPIAWQREVRS